MGLEWKRTRIWNDSDCEWREMFNGDVITIPPRGSIEMSRHDATRFCGQWFDPVDKETKEIKYIKALRKEPILIDTDDPLSGLKKGQCVICRKECGSVLMLENHMKKYHPNAIPVKEKEHDSVGTGNASEESV